MTASAPGRVELLGNHTDYNQGLVLAAAIDRHVTVTGSRRDDACIKLVSERFGPGVALPMAAIARQTANPWTNYPLGVVAALQDAGFRVGGFEVTIGGDLPIGTGLASSAALEVATAYFLGTLFQLDLDPMVLARLCQKAENEFVGLRSGLLDQITSVFGQAGHVLRIDCQTDAVQAIPFPDGVSLVLADSGVRHRLVESEYNVRRDECAVAARSLNVSSLREVSASHLSEAASSMEPTLFRRASHIVGENERVRQGTEALRSGNALAFSELMNTSHESSRVNFENSTAELDLLVSIARSLPGVFGSRLTGGGFGGGTVTLVETSRAAAVARELATVYAERTGTAIDPFICQPADGAAIRNPEN